MLGALIGAGISALGGLWSAKKAGEESTRGIELANAANAQQAQLNRDFQERMANSTYQRAVQDMKAAGLNPALAYQQGGAPSPTGATATMQSTTSQSADIHASAASNAASILQQLANVRLTQAQTQKTQADAEVSRNQFAITGYEGQKLQKEMTPGADGKSVFDKALEQKVATIMAEMGLTNANARDARASAALKEAGQTAAQNQQRIDKTWYGRNFRPFFNDALSAKRLWQ